jgi:hypothetical protein
VSSAPSEAETYTTPSSRITGFIALFIGLLLLVDIAWEWRTRPGLITAALIGVVMVLGYVGLIRPSVTLSPERLSIRNHLRDHDVPWADVEGADVADILRVELAGRRVRCPGVQLMMRDLRRQRYGRAKPDAQNSVTRAGFVVGRIEHHMEYYGKTSTGAVTTRWAVPELAAMGVLALVALVAWLAG